MVTLDEAARIALRDAVALREGEEVLILGNPEKDSRDICEALFETAAELGGLPVHVIQATKTTFDNAERLVLKAIAQEPDVVISISTNKMGKDPYGGNVGRIGRDGKKYPHIFDRLMHGDRRIRGFWSPTCTAEMFARTVPVDYELMKRRAGELKRLLDDANRARVTSPGGTDLTVELGGKKAMVDDGDFTMPGMGGNLPAGETFVAPAQGTQGVIVFDGTVDLVPDPEKPDVPVRVEVEDCFVTGIEGGKTADRLRAVLENGEKQAVEQNFEPHNAWHLGEFGLGLNPSARLVCNMLEDEKVEGTIHIAIGLDFDFEYQAVVHQDCIVLHPTVEIDGRKIMENGKLSV